MNSPSTSFSEEGGRIVLNPGEKYQTEARIWQGCPTLERSRKGRLFAGWYSGGWKEPHPENYNLLVKSDDNGNTWTEPILVIDSIPDKGLRALDIQLWMDPQGRLWVFWEVAKDGSLDVWTLVCDNPDADVLTWHPPRALTQGFARNKPIVLSNGSWLLPAYEGRGDYYMYSRSDDNGATWYRCTAGKKVPSPYGYCHDESMLYEDLKGNIHHLARTHTGKISECISRDDGKTWTDAVDTELNNPNSRFSIGRLQSGKLLLVFNDHAKERANMKAMLSEDDGRTWPYSLMLEERNSCSYPDVAQADDGTIFILTDRNRGTDKEIRLTRIREEDLIAGKPVSKDALVNHLINKAPSLPDDQERIDKIREGVARWLEQLAKEKKEKEQKQPSLINS